jgi:hypothetical protein
VTIKPDETVTVYLWAVAPTVTTPTEFTWRVEVFNIATGVVDDSKEITVKVQVETKIKHEIHVITPTRIKIKAWLHDVVDRPLANKTLEFYKGLSWLELKLFATCLTDVNGYCEVEDEVAQKTYYRVRFPGDDDYASSITNVFEYKPPEKKPAIPWWIALVILILLALRIRIPPRQIPL